MGELVKLFLNKTTTFTLLSGLPGFGIVLLLDKGFKVHRFNPQNVMLLQFCQMIPRLNAFVLLDVGDVNVDGNLLSGRIPDAINGRVRRLTCREANTSRTVIRFGKSAVEMSFGEQCQWGMAYKNMPVLPQMMKPIGDLCQNVSQLSKFSFCLKFSLLRRTDTIPRIGHHFPSHQE